MPYLMKPEIHELSWRTRLHNSKNTVKDTDVLPFPKEEYDSFYAHWIEADPHVRMYRYITCCSCGELPVGECAYEAYADTCKVHVLIHADQRRMKFGTAALHLLAKEAQNHGITSFVAETRCFDTQQFLLALGFQRNQDNRFEIQVNALVSLPCPSECDCCD